MMYLFNMKTVPFYLPFCTLKGNYLMSAAIKRDFTLAKLQMMQKMMILTQPLFGSVFMTDVVKFCLLFNVFWGLQREQLIFLLQLIT